MSETGTVTEYVERFRIILPQFLFLQFFQGDGCAKRESVIEWYKNFPWGNQEDLWINSQEY